MKELHILIHVFKADLKFKVYIQGCQNDLKQPENEREQVTLGAGGPPGGEGSGGRLGPQRGTGAAQQNGFEVFALAEIGSPESNANNPEYLFLNKHHT